MKTVKLYSYNKYQATPGCIAKYCKDCHVWFCVNGTICYDE